VSAEAAKQAEQIEALQASNEKILVKNGYISKQFTP
jgi:hypothetical protein